MKKILFLTFIFTLFIYAQSNYINQIKVVDKCVFLTEVLTVESLGINGVTLENIDVHKAIRACEKSFERHPHDTHIQFLLARAYTKAKQYKEGYLLSQKACRDGDIGGCTLFGGYFYRGLYKHYYDIKKAYMLWLWSCSQGDGQACLNIAMMKDKKNNYVALNDKVKSEYLMETCLSGVYPSACAVYANQVYFKKITYDEVLYEFSNFKACASGEQNACSELETLWKKNKDINKTKKQFFVYTQSCNHKNAKACRRLGDIYRKMPRNKVNNLLAATFYEDGCNNGAERFSCWHAGIYKIALVEGVEQDIDIGIRYLEKSCYIGMNSFACYDLAQFYLYTIEPGYRDVEKARKPLKRACKIGNKRARKLGCTNHIESCCK